MKNKSIFADIIEFDAPDHNTYRAIHTGSHVYEIRKLINGAWILQFKTIIPGKVMPTVKTVWSVIGEHLDNEFLNEAEVNHD
jgi:hypothetical protein